MGPRKVRAAGKSGREASTKKAGEREKNHALQGTRQSHQEARGGMDLTSSRAFELKKIAMRDRSLTRGREPRRLKLGIPPSGRLVERRRCATIVAEPGRRRLEKEE